MTLEFSFDIQPDERGVFDGRELARQFFGMAFHVLNPYVNGCPACVDALFSNIANKVMSELHERGLKHSLAVYALGPDEDKDDRIQAHLEAASATTGAILREADEHHEH